MRAQRRTAAEWAEIITEYEQTGGCQKAFAETRGLKLASFRQWLYKLRRANAGRFVEVQASTLPEDSAIHASPVWLVVADGERRIEFRYEPNAHYLAQLLAAIAGARP